MVHPLARVRRLLTPRFFRATGDCRSSDLRQGPSQFVHGHEASNDLIRGLARLRSLWHSCSLTRRQVPLRRQSNRRPGLPRQYAGTVSSVSRGTRGLHTPRTINDVAGLPFSGFHIRHRKVPRARCALGDSRSPSSSAGNLARQKWSGDGLRRSPPERSVPRPPRAERST